MPFIKPISDLRNKTNEIYRFLVVQNYLVFYTIEERVIWVHRIIHGARNYLSLLLNNKSVPFSQNQIPSI
jgi:hypothetical protein